jgi:predicted Zn-ribbon and HTH transcriptional regulator
MIDMLAQNSCGIRDLSRGLGVSEKEIHGHLEHIRRSVSGQGKRLEITPCECFSCGYVFMNRSRVKKPGRCPKCRQSHIQGAMFRIE